MNLEGNQLNGEKKYTGNNGWFSSILTGPLLAVMPLIQHPGTQREKEKIPRREKSSPASGGHHLRFEMGREISGSFTLL